MESKLYTLSVWENVLNDVKQGTDHIGTQMPLDALPDGMLLYITSCNLLPRKLDGISEEVPLCKGVLIAIRVWGMPVGLYERFHTGIMDEDGFIT